MLGEEHSTLAIDQTLTIEDLEERSKRSTPVGIPVSWISHCEILIEKLVWVEWGLPVNTKPTKRKE